MTEVNDADALYFSNEAAAAASAMNTSTTNIRETTTAIATSMVTAQDNALDKILQLQQLKARQDSERLDRYCKLALSSQNKKSTPAPPVGASQPPAPAAPFTPPTPQVPRLENQDSPMVPASREGASHPPNQDTAAPPVGAFVYPQVSQESAPAPPAGTFCIDSSSVATSAVARPTESMRRRLFPEDGDEGEPVVPPSPPSPPPSPPVGTPTLPRGNLKRGYDTDDDDDDEEDGNDGKRRRFGQ